MNRYLLCSGMSGAIGSEICRIFANNGYNIIGIFNKSDSIAESVQEEILKLGAECDIYKCNLANSDDIEDLTGRLSAKYSYIDTLVNCAGVASFGLFDTFSVNEIEKVLNINLKSTILLSQFAVKKMLPIKKGSIITISSMWGEVGASCEVIYSASKAGLIGFTKALAKEVSPSGIRVNCITPGLIQSDMNSALCEEDLAVIIEETPLQRIGMPSDVASAALFLASENASFITGEVLKVNGGLVV